MSSFQWLHLTDLHVGVNSQDWLWPSVKNALYQDLTRLRERCGKWSMVIFSGDFVQAGKSDEFAKLDEIIEELWDLFASLDVDAKLFAVPGNHDLVRPGKTDPGLMLLEQWWSNKVVRDEMFANSSSLYREVVEGAFEHYTLWERRLCAKNISLPFTPGIFPGDKVSSLCIDGMNVGIVGLNSTWLALTSRDYIDSLHVDVRQIQAVTGGDLFKWREKNDCSLLVSHHPLSWLHAESRSYWDSDIAPPGIFDAHFFGHMHEAKTNCTSVNGSRNSLSIQGPSIFGLKLLEGKPFDRVHGFSLGRLEIANAQKEVRIWPRILYRKGSGLQKMVPDTEFDIDEATSSFIALKTGFGPFPIAERLPPQAADGLPEKPDGPTLLASFLYPIRSTPSHNAIRKIEQEKLKQALRDQSIAWLVSDWGLSSNEFLASVRPLDYGSAAFRIDVSRFTERDAFFASFRDKFGASFETFCEAFSDVGSSILILDDFEKSVESNSTNVAPECDLEAVAKIILRFCPNANIVLRSGRLPSYASLSVIELTGLDEPETMTYLRHNEKGIRFAHAGPTNAIFRYSEGIPARIDTALKELEIISISELQGKSSEVSTTSIAGQNRNTPLGRTIERLASSKETSNLRAYDLLKVLSVFPNGEKFFRIRRILGRSFYSTDAQTLKDRRLIDSNQSETLSRVDDDEYATLKAYPSVKDYMLSRMKSAERHSLDRKVAELFFGINWPIGEIKVSSRYKFDNAHCAASDIYNANALIKRLLSHACFNIHKQQIEGIVKLASNYTLVLSNGDHFRSLVVFCDEVLPIIPRETNYAELRLSIRQRLATALRMTGFKDRAIVVAEEALQGKPGKRAEQDLLNNIALCHQSAGRIEEALDYASRVVKIDARTSTGLQSRSILLELSNDDPAKVGKLMKLERLCRKRNAVTLANNISLVLAKKYLSINDADETLRRVARTSSEVNDYYNQVRAILAMSDLGRKRGARISSREEEDLVRAYDFLFNERFHGLFDRCHDAVSKQFLINTDVQRLFSLFRKSSLVWQLRNDEEKEKAFAAEIGSKLSLRAGDAVAGLTKERSYFALRAAALLPAPATLNDE